MMPILRAVALVLMITGAAGAQTCPTVAAGDAEATSAVLWVQCDGPRALVAEVAEDAGFAGIVGRFEMRTEAAADHAGKVIATGLAPGRRYFYRFRAGDGALSGVGRFRTPAGADQAVAVRMAFSGDADGRFRPFPLLAGFGTTAPGTEDLDFFAFIGDTIYETASGGGAGVSRGVPELTASSAPGAVAEAIAVYQRKYRENVSGVGPEGAMADAGQPGLRALFAAAGHTTLLDNHELGNRALQSGGAPPTAGARVRPGEGFEVNTTGAFNNQSPAFQALNKVFLDTHPTRAALAGAWGERLRSVGPTVAAPGDARSDGVARQYFATRWGRHALYIQVDDRSFRDARLGTEKGGDDVGARAGTPGRTMLGATQLAWLKETLRGAKRDGVAWKIITISTPIDASGSEQDGKSWLGGYKAERDDLLAFIAAERLDGVVFITTDDHMVRSTRLAYEAKLGDPASRTLLPGAVFQVVAGPIGAGGPDEVTDHSSANLIRLAEERSRDLVGRGEPDIGLCGMAGLGGLFREGDPTAGTACRAFDFFSTDTFNYTTLEVSADGRSLSVATYGIDSHKGNLFLDAARAGAPRRIIAYRVTLP